MEDRMAPDIRHDEQRARFVAFVDGHEAYLSYAVTDERTLDFQHTYVPPELRGRQLARHLVDAAFRHAQAAGYRVIPTCSYVRRVVEQVAAYAALVT